MSVDLGVPGHAVRLDLRAVTGPGAPPGEGARTVRDALALVRSPEAGRRFLVVDAAAELDRNQLLYEQLFAHGAARILCLAVGAAEGAAQDGPGTPAPAVRPLARPLSLRPPDAGVLWVLDALAGQAQTPAGAVGTAEPAGEDDVLRPLAEVLCEPAVFDAVLHALGQVRDGVAVPSVRILEHDLTDSARRRAWRQALDTLAGEEVPAPALVAAASPAGHSGHADEDLEGTGGAGGTGSPEAVPAELAPLLGGGVPRSIRERAWLVQGGDAETKHRRCEHALRDATGAYERTWPAAGLFTSARKQADIPGPLRELADALHDFREAVGGAFTDGDGLRLLPEQRSRLARRGIELPEITEVSRESVAPGLRGYTERLLGRGLPLRSVAARLGALCDLSAPAGSAARLTELKRICPGEHLRRLATPALFVVAERPRPTDFSLAFLLAFVAGLWPSLGWLVGPSAGVAMALPALLMLRRRPSRSPDGRLDGGGDTGWAGRVVAGVAGGVAGGLVGQLVGVPSWLGPAALVLTMALSASLSVRDWTRAVEAWWAEMRVDEAVRCLREIDDLVAETAVHDWLFADARYHCSDGARAVAALLRRVAVNVETYEVPAPAPRGSGHGYEYETADHAVRIPDVGGTTRPPDLGAGVSEDTNSGASSWSWDTWSDAVEAEPGDGAFDDLLPPPRPAAPEAETVVPYHLGGDIDQPSIPEGPLGGAVVPPWLSRETGEGGAALVPTLVSDLADGITQLLGTCWATVERDPEAAARLRVEPRVHELLGQEHAALCRDAAAAPPSFVRATGASGASGSRPAVALLLGVPGDRTAEALGTEGFADRTVRLCAAEHRRMLSKDPGAERRVRFAPEAARRGAEAVDPDGWRGATDDVVWTPGGRRAGVLGLVPLRAGGVRTVRSYDGPEPEAEGEFA
ncbi:hypothetical protein ACIQM4_01100 [Streptomyces sp. NPDC091272]|uniref:hypothetical protein n=1 Tax=Streptomyces sp. NPDC091272 TaxID=3365981 RepID=UPI003807E4CE